MEETAGVDEGALARAAQACAEVQQLVAEKGIRLVDYWFTEVGGRPWRLSMSADSLTPEMFSVGVVVDGKQVGGSWEGLMAIRPDAAAIFSDPTVYEATLSILCDIVRPSGGAYSDDPRSLLKRAETHFRSRHPDSAWNVGAEVEFFLLEPSGEPVGDAGLRETLREMWTALGASGIRVDWFRIGPAKGQGRVQMRSGGALLMADQVVIYKNVVRSVAAKRGKRVKFLPKPFAGEGSAAMLVHHSFWRGGGNRFHDPAGWANTSRLGRSFAAGLLDHAPALLAFCAPTVNSYRRLLPGGPGTERVVSTTLTAAVCRIPAGTTGPAPGSRRVKFCSCDPTANPYLAFAALLLAGLDGIDKQLEPAIDPAPSAGPMPHSLEAALEAMNADRDFLKAGGVFTDQLLDRWTQGRWKEQILPVRSVPHPVELQLDEHDG